MKKVIGSIGIVITLSLIFLSACGEEYVPFARKYAFPRLDLPTETSYQVFESEACAFSFEYPEVGKLTRNQEDSCWVNISLEEYDATFHVNGRSILTSGRPLEVHLEEHRRLIYNHSVKAARIVPEAINMANGAGTKYEMVGEVGTPMQVFFHDEAGEESVILSFYYQSALKNDSLAPVTEYLKGQLDHIVETIEWK